MNKRRGRTTPMPDQRPEWAKGKGGEDTWLAVLAVSALLRETQMTPEQVAERTGGISGSALRKWMAHTEAAEGAKPLSPPNMARVSAVLGEMGWRLAPVPAENYDTAVAGLRARLDRINKFELLDPEILFLLGE